MAQPRVWVARVMAAAAQGKVLEDYFEIVNPPPILKRTIRVLVLREGIVKDPTY